MGPDVPSDAGILEERETHLPDPSPSKGRRRVSIFVAAVATVVTIAVVALVAVWRSRNQPTPVASSVQCAVYWRGSDRVQPNHAGDVTLTIRNPPVGPNEQRLTAGTMTFAAAVPNVDPGFRMRGPGSDGGDLSITVADNQGRSVAHQLYQIWEGPTDNYGGNTGFTGLVYVNNPATGAEVQYSCTAIP